MREKEELSFWQKRTLIISKWRKSFGFWHQRQRNKHVGIIIVDVVAKSWEKNRKWFLMFRDTRVFYIFDTKNNWQQYPHRLTHDTDCGQIIWQKCFMNLRLLAFFFRLNNMFFYTFIFCVFNGRIDKTDLGAGNDFVHEKLCAPDSEAREWEGGERRKKNLSSPTEQIMVSLYTPAIKSNEKRMKRAQKKSFCCRGRDEKKPHTYSRLYTPNGKYIHSFVIFIARHPYAPAAKPHRRKHPKHTHTPRRNSHNELRYQCLNIIMMSNLSGDDKKKLPENHKKNPNKKIYQNNARRFYEGAQFFLLYFFFHFGYLLSVWHISDFDI
jgi:hypothetical protein